MTTELIISECSMCAGTGVDERKTKPLQRPVACAKCGGSGDLYDALSYDEYVTRQTQAAHETGGER